MAKVSVLLIAVALIAGMAGCDGYPPCPTPLPSQNLEIWDWYDLDDVRNNLAGNHTLMNDLDSTTAGYEELASPTANQGKGWEPIGTFIPMCAYGGLIGTFDGQGYEIRDLFINRPDEYLVGLFGCVYEEGVIKDIGVMNSTVIGKSSVGGLVGRNMGAASNSYAIGSVGADFSVGGLVGYNQGPVSNCYATGNVVAGGVVGNVSAVMGGFGVGGLIGLSEEGPVDNCYFTGSVTSYLSCADGWEFLAGVGGLVGVNYDTVSNSYSNADVTGQYGVGGLVGRNLFGGTVNNCYSTGSVTGEVDVGGLVGDTVVYGTVSNSYYDRDEVLINGENIITIGALFAEDFEEWAANDRFLDVNERLYQENGYYLIDDVSAFKQLLAFGQNATLKFRLTSDLDLGGEPNFYIPYLSGEFDGNGHKISNLSLNFDLVSPLGLFGYLTPGGKVTQVGVENINIAGYSSVGGLVGDTCEGTVSDSYSSGTVTGEDGVGGLVGHSNFGIVSDSYSTATVTGYSAVGGLIGGNGGTVSNCFWDTETSGQATSDGGTGKTKAQMQDIATFSGAGWNIVAVAPGETNNAYTWNIVDKQTYPFLSWEL